MAEYDVSYPDLPRAIVVANGPAALVGSELVELSGARVLKQLGWDEVVVGGLRDYAVADLMLIDTVGISGDILDAALPAIDAFAGHADSLIVATIAEQQIDEVAGQLYGRHVQVLVAPRQRESVAALTLAANMQANIFANDATRDGEALRLRRLNEEVARIAETLARLTRDDSLVPERASLGVTDRKLGYGAQPDSDDAPVTQQEVRQAIRSRRLRSQFFDDGLFEDPAWDMLLDLFAAELERAQVSVSSLCIAAAVAPTTALRWIAKMTEAGLFVRHPDPFDRRRAFMALSDKAREAMRQYCASVRRSGLSIA